ncbi:MAG TPA: hypothetical protein VG075_04425 [Candidatus Acidoferrum sp.]|jgi:hypothetical protein|nr:hypothetical protein [Candidatus Acidoferrum sp.]
MNDGALGTYTKFQNLLRHMTATELSNLFQIFGFDFVTTQWISRITKAGKLNLDVDQKLRALVLRIEDLIERGQPLPISFADNQHVKMLLDLIGHGVDLQIDASISADIKE